MSKRDWGKGVRVSEREEGGENVAERGVGWKGVVEGSRVQGSLDRSSVRGKT